jgi:hypothetical protein
MPVADITVKYVNPPRPGKKMGSIKTTGDEYYNVWPDKLGLFNAGQNYNIEYDVNDQGFKSFKKLVGDSANGQVPVGTLAAARAHAPAPATRSGGDAKAAEMFVMGFMNRCYQGMGSVPPHGQLVIELRTLKSAWEEAWTMPRHDAPTREDVTTTYPTTKHGVSDDLPNDDIPF